MARTSNEVAAESEAGLALTPGSFAALVSMEAKGTLSATQSKAVLSALLAAGGGDPAAVASEMGFEALGTDTLVAAVDEVVAAHPEEWARLVDGDEKLQGFFIRRSWTRPTTRPTARKWRPSSVVAAARTLANPFGKPTELAAVRDSSRSGRGRVGRMLLAHDE